MLTGVILRDGKVGQVGEIARLLLILKLLYNKGMNPEVGLIMLITLPSAFCWNAVIYTWPLFNILFPFSTFNRCTSITYPLVMYSKLVIFTITG